jgi:hypothetical protein
MSEEYFCENHSAMKAVAVCTICGKPVCGDCAVTKEGKNYCDEINHPKIGADYDVLLLSPTIFELELIAKNLEANGISVYSSNPQKFGVNQLPMLYVKKDQKQKAADIVADLDLTDFSLPNTYGT